MSDDLPAPGPDDLDILAQAARETVIISPPRRCAVDERLVAAALDLGGVFSWLAMTMVIYSALGREVIGHLLPDQFMYLVMATSALAYSALEVVRSASPGKILLGLKIARADGRPAPAVQRLLRWVIKQPHLFALVAWAGLQALQIIHPMPGVLAACAAAPMLVLLIAALSLLGRLLVLLPGRQPLHDRVAGTAVFHASDLRRLPPPRPFEVLLPHSNPMSQTPR